MSGRRSRPVAAAPMLASDLPETARNLVRLIGWSATQALVRELGGIPYPVPKGPNNNRAGAQRFARLAEIVGEPAALTLVAEYGGEGVLTVPNCKTAVARAAMREMKARCDAGATLEAIALEFGCTTRWVSIVLKRPDEADDEDGQMRLL